jgi:hypothetical protein
MSSQLSIAVECPSRKVTFKTRAKANRFIRERNGPGKLASYQCPQCKFWHTTKRAI